MNRASVEFTLADCSNGVHPFEQSNSKIKQSQRLGYHIVVGINAMKILFSLLFAGLIAASALAQDSSNALAAGENLAAGIGKADFSLVESSVSPDASVYWIHAKFKNRRQFEQYLQGQFSSFDKHALVFNQEGTVEDETISTSWGDFVFDYGKTGTPVSSHFLGRYTAVAQKVNGAWQIVSLHLSLPFPPDLPPVIN